jgi:hypothetical protein
MSKGYKYNVDINYTFYVRSFLNIMLMAKSIIILKLQSFTSKLCAVAIHG